MTLRTKILAIAATLCATAFYAGCDDSSSSPAAPAPTPTEGDISSSSVQTPEPLPTSSEPAETAEPESSSSVEEIEAPGRKFFQRRRRMLRRQRLHRAAPRRKNRLQLPEQHDHIQLRPLDALHMR